MSFMAIIGIAALIFIFVIFFTNIGADYTKKTDQELLNLWPLHERNIKAAKAAGPNAYRAAIEKSSTLTNELKRRGLLAPDFTFENDVLDSMAKKMFSKNIDNIRKLAKEKDPIALYQLGMIFHSIKENHTSIQYVSEAANLGNPDAQYALGWAFMTDGSGVTPSKASALMWLMIAADHGHDDAQKALGIAQKSSTSQEIATATSEAKKWITHKGNTVHL